MKFLLLILKNVRRNLLRSSLTALGTMALVIKLKHEPDMPRPPAGELAFAHR